MASQHARYKGRASAFRSDACVLLARVEVALNEDLPTHQRTAHASSRATGTLCRLPSGDLVVPLRVSCASGTVPVVVPHVVGDDSFSEPYPRRPMPFRLRPRGAACRTTACAFAASALSARLRSTAARAHLCVQLGLRVSPRIRARRLCGAGYSRVLQPAVPVELRARLVAPVRPLQGPHAPVPCEAAALPSPLL